MGRRAWLRGAPLTYLPSAPLPQRGPVLRYRKLKFTGTVGSNSQITGNQIEGLGA